MQDSNIKTITAIKHAYNLVFSNRNSGWVDQLEEISRQGHQTYMVIIGAGHFFGPDNLLELLRARDYVVETVD